MIDNILIKWFSTKNSKILSVDSDLDTQVYSRKMMNEFLSKYDTDDTYYNRDLVYKNNSKTILSKLQSA